MINITLNQVRLLKSLSLGERFPLSNLKGNGYFLHPVWKREYRPSYVAPQKMKREEKISMKWKYDSFGGDKNGK